MGIVWSSQARTDLRAIRDFIGRDSEHYASLQTERLVARVERASKMPSRGHPVHEFMDSGLREVHEGSYRIIYRVQADEFQVVTLVHMKQRIRRRRLR
ncbi:MAG: type II toxin-antitoxin system RelE/ParE family toxin [Verrucomicrobia bacterium]|nr:MAG: type II toxin-antitoxin system RelE/ParE family toxin [Verrucomicrobiota bacterium]TAE86538.1 MAG: type II toxin-antitoxin system RelE/ParE family toxin [Verrucomicrobiota bacterium]TAF24233.1 MAG: type II toxin-antitoxin system RelE/ParE family toxin [Verrucomicrobiota bacterium]